MNSRNGLNRCRPTARYLETRCKQTHFVRRKYQRRFDREGPAPIASQGCNNITSTRMPTRVWWDPLLQSGAVRFKGARTISRWTAALMLSIAFCVAVVGAEWAHIGSGGAPTSGAYVAAAGPYGEFAADTEHPHLIDGCLASNAMPHGVLPRGTTALVLVALGLLASIAAAVARWRHTAIAVIRGPPRAVANVMVGQVLLTHLCIARR